MYITFKTPTDFDIKAITTFGISSKPNSESPIGYFGTGLKYALAILCREGLDVTIINKDLHLKLFTAHEAFRNKEFNYIKLRNKKEIIDLPFTTELGKNWKLWQAFRELYSNTLDENGTVLKNLRLPKKSQAKNNTYICVKGEAFEEVFNKLDSIYLDDKYILDKNETVKVKEGSSDCIYYHGMRVKDLKTKSLYTWNIIETINLTEDRTAAYDFQVERAIAKYIVCDCNDGDMIEKILTEKDTYEANLNYTHVYDKPSELFKSIYRLLKAKTNSYYLPDFMSPILEQENLENLTWQQKLKYYANSFNREKVYDLVSNNLDYIVNINTIDIDAVNSKLDEIKNLDTQDNTGVLKAKELAIDIKTLVNWSSINEN